NYGCHGLSLACLRSCLCVFGIVPSARPERLLPADPHEYNNPLSAATSKKCHIRRARLLPTPVRSALGMVLSGRTDQAAASVPVSARGLGGNLLGQAKF